MLLLSRRAARLTQFGCQTGRSRGRQRLRLQSVDVQPVALVSVAVTSTFPIDRISKCAPAFRGDGTVVVGCGGQAGVFDV